MEIGFWKEKWNYKVQFSEDVSENVRKDFSSQPVVYDPCKAKPLIWNNFEKTVINKLFNIIKKLFEVNGFKPIKFYESQILIFDKDEFIEKELDGDKSRGAAFCRHGRIFMFRNKERSLFINHLAHELSHLFSYEASLVKSPNLYHNLQFGYRKVNYENQISFEGLNEAATEFWAHIIIDMLVEDDFLSSNEKEELVSIVAYPCHVKFFSHFLDDDFNNGSLIWPFYKSYIDGTDDFLNVLEKFYPGLKDILEHMTEDKDSLLEAVQKIGDESLSKKIIPCIKAHQNIRD